MNLVCNLFLVLHRDPSDEDALKLIDEIRKQDCKSNPAPEKKKTVTNILDYSKSYHIIPYHAIPCHIISYHIIPYHIIPYHIISYHIIPYHILSYGILCLAISYRILSCFIILCVFHDMPYHIEFTVVCCKSVNLIGYHGVKYLLIYNTTLRCLFACAIGTN